MRKEPAPWSAKQPQIVNQRSTSQPSKPTIERGLGIHELLQPATTPLPSSELPTEAQAPEITYLEELELDPGILESDYFQCETSFQPSPLVTGDLVKGCVNAFFTHKYPIMPILGGDEIFDMIPRIATLPEQYGLITALCALMVHQREIVSTGPEAEASNPPGVKTWPPSEFLISETKRARQFHDHIESPSLVTVHTSFFLYAALFCLGKDNSAWFYIRESMTMLQLLRLHEETTYSNILDQQYATYCRRTFWLLFITERAYALQRHRPLTLQRTIDLPTVDPGSEANILSGFLDLVSLFQNFDDKFLSSWNLPGTDALALS